MILLLATPAFAQPGLSAKASITKSADWLRVSFSESGLQPNEAMDYVLSTNVTASCAGGASITANESASYPITAGNTGKISVVGVGMAPPACKLTSITFADITLVDVTDGATVDLGTLQH
jgi:hypothetical protein